MHSTAQASIHSVLWRRWIRFIWPIYIRWENIWMNWVIYLEIIIILLCMFFLIKIENYITVLKHQRSPQTLDFTKYKLCSYSHFSLLKPLNDDLFWIEYVCWRAQIFHYPKRLVKTFFQVQTEHNFWLTWISSFCLFLVIFNIIL